MFNTFLRAVRAAVIACHKATLISIFSVLSAGIACADERLPTPILAQIGQTVTLDPTDALDVAGQGLLAVQWSWESRPDISVAEFSASTTLRPSVTLDAAGVYLARADFFVDLGAAPIASVLVEIGTDNISPVAVIRARGLPNLPTEQVGIPEVETLLQLDATASFDLDGDQLSYEWSILTEPVENQATFSNATDPMAQLVVKSEGLYTVGLVVRDGTGRVSQTATYDAAFWLGGPNFDRYNRDVAPVAAAGFDHLSVAVGDALLVDGYQSTDIDGPKLNHDFSVSYAPAGAVFSLDTDSNNVARFSAQQEGEYLLSLRVTDGGNVATDQILVVVGAQANTRPVARIGQYAQAAIGSAITVNGSQSYDLDGDLIAHNWAVIARPGQSSAVIADVTAPLTSFTPDQPGLYVVQLYVADADGTSIPVTQAILVDDASSFATALPIANAGPDVLLDMTSQGVLDGALSSGDGTSYSWSMIGITNATLPGTIADPTAVAPSVITDFRRVRLDETVKSTPIYLWERDYIEGICYISTRRFDDIVGADPSDPVLLEPQSWGRLDDAGQTLQLWGIKNKRAFTQEVRLQGPDGTVYGSVIVPGLTSALLTTTDIGADQMQAWIDDVQYGDVTGTTTPFINDSLACTESEGTAAQLVVSDAQGFVSFPDAAFVGQGNLRPVLTVGQVAPIAAGDVADLNAQSYVFDANGDTIAAAWSLIGRPADSDATIATDPAIKILPGDTIDFAPDVAGTYLLQLMASDDALAAVPVVFVVDVGNSAPVAVASDVAPVFVGEVAVLDGRGSFDPDNNALSYRWSVTARPVGSTAAIDDVSQALASFTPDVVGPYGFALTVSDFGLTSAPVSVALVVPNREPQLAITSPSEVNIGAQAIFDASASVDPDGDALTYTLTVANAPVGAVPEIVELSPGVFGVTVDTAGDYAITVTVSDGTATASSTTELTASPTNAAPVLGVINDTYTVELGLEFALDLTAFDADGDALTFFADPLPLVDGMALDAVTGEVRFRPEVGQTGSYSFTLGVSDSTLTDEAAITVAVVPGTASDTSVFGRVLDGIDFGNGTETPLAGIPVRLDGAALQTVTDSTGAFSFGSLTAGSDVVRIDPNAAGGPGGYLAVERRITVTENQDRDLSPAFLLTPLNEGCAMVVAGQDTILTGAVTGVNVTIAADTILATDGSAFTGEVCLGSLPQQTAVQGFPADTLACQIYGLSAPGAIFSAGMTIAAPNYDNLPETTRLTFWQKSGSADFRRSGNASVDAGALTVSSVGTRLSADGLFTFLPQAPVTVASGDQPTGNRQLTVFEGDLNETYTMPGYFAFNQQQQIGLSYHSAAADPTVIVAGDVTIADDMSLPVTMSTRIDVGGLSVASDAIWTPREGADGSIPALVGEAVNMRQSTPLDATGLASGRYPYDFIAKANYDCSTVSAQHQAEVYVQNKTDSPYGVGWSIDGLQKLTQNPDGSVAIIDDDGIVTFDPQATLTAFDGNPIVFPAVGPVTLTVSDFDGNGLKDAAVFEAGTGFVRFIYNDGDRDFRFEDGIRIADPVNVPDNGVIVTDVRNLKSGDFNNDGHIDLAYAVSDGSFGYLAGDGLGNFEKVALEPIGNQRFNAPKDLTVADFDGNGYDDIAVLATGSSIVLGDLYIYVEFNGPAGPTRERVYFRSFEGAGFQLESADFDNDGNVDLAYRNDSGVAIIQNNGDNTFNRRQSGIGVGLVQLFGPYFDIGDFDNDGLLDIVWSGPNELAVYINDGGVSFPDTLILPRPPGASYAGRPNIIDANGDGNNDFIFSDRFATGLTSDVVVFTNDANGGFLPAESGLVDHAIILATFERLNTDNSFDMISTQQLSITIDFSDPAASGKFNPGAGEFSQLTQLPDGTWQRRYKDGMIVEFDAAGLQTAEVDPQGNRRTFAYDADGRMATVTDQVGGITTFAYDANGRLASTTYPDGRTTLIEYGDAGTLAAMTEPTGSVVNFTYDDNNRLISTTNQNGNTSTYDYDATGKMSGASLPDGSSVRNQVASSLGLIDGLGNQLPNPLRAVAPEDRMTTVTDRKGQITEIIVNKFGATVQVTDPLGRVTRMTRNNENLVTRVERPSDAVAGGIRVDEIDYDNNANVTRMAEAVGTPQERSTQYIYEPEFNNVTSMTDADGFTTLYEYDAFGEATKITDPQGGERLFSYTPEGKLTSRTDENGNATAFIYNANQNLGQMTYADGSITTMTYDATGNTAAVNEAVGTLIERQVQRTYDALNRVLTVEVTGADGAQIDGITQYSYAPAGNLATVTDETGLVTTMSYDPLERLVALNDPAEGLIQRTYNAAGEVTEHINGDGETHAYGYDNVSRLSQTTDPEGFIKSFDYDSRNNVTSVTDGRGGLTTFGFDPLDRMTTRTNPIGQTMTRAYDPRDNLSVLTREDGLVETATYDGLNRRTQVVTPDNTLTYAYDARSNLTEAADNDSRVTFAYDTRNRLASTTTDGTVGPQPEVTISYTHDELDRRTSMSDSLGGTTTYAYDFEDRLTDLTAPWGTVYSFGYDGEGRRTSLTSTSGRNTAYGYTNGLLTALSHAQSGVALTDLVYNYDVDGQLTAITDNLDPAKSLGINYDDLNQLVQVDQGDPAGVTLPIEDYAYDGEGNRLASHLSSLYNSNDHNQLEEDDSYTYAYDQRGNRTSRTDKASGAVETYTYDSQNRLIGYASDTTTASYAYDAMERRIAKTVDGDSTAYVYDTSMENPLAHDDIVLEFEVGTTPFLKRRWAHSVAVDEPLGYEQYLSTQDPGAGIERAMFADRQGSVLYVTSPVTDQVVAAYEYDGFGAITQTEGTMQQPYGYTGREFDVESGLYYYRARSYDPTTGMFVQSDPIGFAAGSLNLNSYTSNNPFRYNDPNGLTAAEIGAINTTSKGATVGVVGSVGSGVFSMLSKLRVLMALAGPIVLSVDVSDEEIAQQCAIQRQDAINAANEVFEECIEFNNDVFDDDPRARAYGLAGCNDDLATAHLDASRAFERCLEDNGFGE